MRFNSSLFGRTPYRHLFLWAMLTFGIISCAPQPVYESNELFIAPESHSGKSCIVPCGTQKNRCETDCAQNYQHCVTQVESEVRQNFPNVVDIYKANLDVYAKELDIYNYNLHHYQEHQHRLNEEYGHAKSQCNQKIVGGCDLENQISNQLSKLKEAYYGYDGPLRQQPDRPKKPDLEKEIAKTRSQKCDSQKCGCDNNYRSCFSSCGGTIRTETRCVRNCSK